MNKIKGNLALVPQHRVILASRGHGGEAVRILYLETRGRRVVSVIQWQFYGREKEHKNLKMHSSMGELHCRFGRREEEKTRFLTPRQYSQVTFVVQTAMHIFH